MIGLQPMYPYTSLSILPTSNCKYQMRRDQWITSWVEILKWEYRQIERISREVGIETNMHDLIDINVATEVRKQETESDTDSWIRKYPN